MLVAELAFDRDLQIGIAVETAPLTTIGAELVDIDAHRYAPRAVATMGAIGVITAAPNAEFEQPFVVSGAQSTFWIDECTARKNAGKVTHRVLGEGDQWQS